MAFTAAGVMAAGSLLAGAGTFLGATGAFGGGGPNQHKRRERELMDANLAAVLQNTRLQEHQYYHGLQTRVKDARRAGVHPLYAIGAGIGGGLSPGMTGMGAGGGGGGGGLDFEGMGVGAEQFATGVSELMQLRAEREKSEVLRNEAEAAKLSSDAARVVQTPAIVMGDPSPQETRAVRTPSGRVYHPTESSPASVVEDEYGGAVGELYGIWRTYQVWKANQELKKRAQERIRRQGLEQWRWSDTGDSVIEDPR